MAEHLPVLLEESVEALAIRPDGVYVDATFGRGGHARALLARLGEYGRLVVLDRDPAAIAFARKLAEHDRRLIVEQAPFSRLVAIVAAHGLKGRVDGVLLDLGVSSPQLDEPERGFSFSHDGPLDMRMDPSSGVAAADWLNQADQAEIARVLREFGEERFAGRIAQAVVAARARQPITRTLQLAALVAAAVPTREPGKHPATRTFQAIRIYLNRELDELQAVLTAVGELLSQGGRLVVISFHSLEDRIVKRFIREASQGPSWPRRLPIATGTFQPMWRAVSKPVRPRPAELQLNPRARSAIMRVAERLS